MKVIFLEEVRNVAGKFDVKEVSDGYARNFLFPNKLAEPATPGALKKLDAMKAEHDKNEADLLARLHEIARKINDTKIEFTVKTDKSGAVFGSVNKESVLKALREHELVRTERLDIDLKYPLKEIGEYTIPIDLKKGVLAKLRVVIAKEGEK
jgi:large subunit ribosomal protein L9